MTTWSESATSSSTVIGVTATGLMGRSADNGSGKARLHTARTSKRVSESVLRCMRPPMFIYSGSAVEPRYGTTLRRVKKTGQNQDVPAGPKLEPPRRSSWSRSVAEVAWPGHRCSTLKPCHGCSLKRCPWRIPGPPAASDPVVAVSRISNGSTRRAQCRAQSGRIA